MLDKYVIQDGIDQNLLVFDANAPRGLFTDRHAALLKSVSRYNRLGRLEAVYVPEEIEVEGENGNACGLYVIPDKRLNLDGELLRYYLEEKKASLLAHRNEELGRDRYLIVAVGQTNVLLGSVN